MFPEYLPEPCLHALWSLTILLLWETTLYIFQPTLVTALANISAPSFESTNTTTGGRKCLRSLIKSNSLFFFDVSSTQRMICFTDLFGALGGPTDINTGFCSNFDAIFSIDAGMVAENINFWDDAGMCWRILSTCKR